MGAVWSLLQSCCRGMKINTCGETAQFQAGSHESDPEYDAAVLFYIIVFPFMPFFHFVPGVGEDGRKVKREKVAGKKKKISRK